VKAVSLPAAGEVNVAMPKSPLALVVAARLAEMIQVDRASYDLLRGTRIRISNKYDVGLLDVDLTSSPVVLSRPTPQGSPNVHLTIEGSLVGRGYHVVKMSPEVDESILQPLERLIVKGAERRWQDELVLFWERSARRPFMPSGIAITSTDTGESQRLGQEIGPYRIMGSELALQALFSGSALLSLLLDGELTAEGPYAHTIALSNAFLNENLGGQW
jgi:hypothetical protein